MDNKKDYSLLLIPLFFIFSIGLVYIGSNGFKDKISSELELLLNHVFTILTQFKQFQVDVWCCSTHVHENTFTTYTAANKNTLHDFKIASDGGTDMSANLPFIEKKYAGKMPDVVMIFTDGFDDLNGDTKTRTKFRIIWLIVDNKNFKKPALIPGAVYPFETER